MPFYLFIKTVSDCSPFSLFLPIYSDDAEIRMMDLETLRADRLTIPSISKLLDHAGQATTSMDDWIFIFGRSATSMSTGRTRHDQRRKELPTVHVPRTGRMLMKANPMLNRIDSESYGNFKDAVIRQFSKDKSEVRGQFSRRPKKGIRNLCAIRLL